MKRFFVLGSRPGLSVAEITSVWNARNLEVPAAGLLLAEVENGAPATESLNRLGGTVKLGRLEESEPTPENLAAQLEARAIKRPKFGISDHGLAAEAGRKQQAKAVRALVRLGMETKRLLKEAGFSSRFVRPQQGTELNSVAIAKNRLLRDGAEFVLMGSDERFGLTEAVQDFELFSKMDYGRPARDTAQGMLPPKLARMMLNLIGQGRPKPDSRVWDPFCGSGTVLTEAMRLGVRQLRGSDLNPQAIRDSEANIAYTKEQLPETAGASIRLSCDDARQPPGDIKDKGIDAIVSEVFLGAPRQGRESKGELTTRLNEISLLVEKSLIGWRSVLAPGGAIVLALPAYVTGEDVMLTEMRLPRGYRWSPLLDSDLAARLSAELTPTKGGLLYGRESQLVWREIVRIEKG